MNDSGSLFSTNYRKISMRIVKQRVHHCSTFSIHSWNWMNIDAGVFIQNDKIIIFVDDIKRNMFRQDIYAIALAGKSQNILILKKGIFLRNSAINTYLSLLDTLGDIRARKIRKKS